MNDQAASEKLKSLVVVTREDIARAKVRVMAVGAGDPNEIANEWLREQNLAVPQSIDGDSPNLTDVLGVAARAISLKLAVFQAVWELIAAGELFPALLGGRWQPGISYRTARIGSGLNPGIICSYPERIERPPLATQPLADVDVFLQGVNCQQLHPGTRIGDPVRLARQAPWLMPGHPF